MSTSRIQLGSLIPAGPVRWGRGERLLTRPVVAGLARTADLAVVVAAGIVAGFLRYGTGEPENVDLVRLVHLCGSLAAATIFPALMMGIFSKRITSEGAIAGMLAGLVFTCLYIFTYLGWFFIPGTNWLENTPENHIFGIAPTAIGSVGALLNFAVAYGVSAVTKAPPADVQDMVESIRIPRGAQAAAPMH